MLNDYGFVTYSQMDAFLASNKSFKDFSEIFNSARIYFENKSLIQNSINAIFPQVDFYEFTDKAFEEVTNKFPIPLSSSYILNNPISSETLPTHTECFMTRHLNHLNSFEHSHNFFEISYVMRGSCSHSFYGTNIKMNQGDLLIIPPMTKHSISIQDKSSVVFSISVNKNSFNTTFFNILTLNNTLSSFFRDVLHGNSPNLFLLIHTNNNEILNRIIKHIAFECYTLTSTTNIFISHVVSQVFEFIIRDGVIDDSFYISSNENLSISNVVHYIQRNYRFVTLNKLTEIFNVNEAYLSRCIKNATNYSFSELLYNIRMEHARKLLSHTDSNLDIIAELVGYIDTSAFSKAFKRKTGKSPLQYRNKYTTINYQDAHNEKQLL